MDRILSFARMLPRGGLPLVRMLCRVDPLLRAYPVHLKRVDNYRMICDLSESAYYLLFKHGYFPDQLGEEAVARRLIAETSNVIDVGANVGYYSALFASIASKGLVHAFEPSPRAFGYLKQVERDFPNLRAVNLALSDREAVLGFRELRSLSMSHICDESVEGDGMIRVSATTLDRWAAGSGIPVDFIKVDVEGHELQVLRGGTETIRRHRPAIMFEALDTDHLRGIATFFDELAAGYEVGRITRDGDVVSLRGMTSLSAGRGTGLTYNYLAAPRERACPQR